MERLKGGGRGVYMKEEGVGRKRRSIRIGRGGGSRRRREVGEGGWKRREKEGRRREEKDLKEEPVSISNLPHALPVNS